MASAMRDLCKIAELAEKHAGSPAAQPPNSSFIIHNWCRQSCGVAALLVRHVTQVTPRKGRLQGAWTLKRAYFELIATIVLEKGKI